MKKYPIVNSNFVYKEYMTKFVDHIPCIAGMTMEKYLNWIILSTCMNCDGKTQGVCLVSYWFICLFGILCRFQHCTGHITMGSWKGRGNQYIQFARVLYCKLPTNGKQLPAFPLTAMTGIEPRPQRWEARVLPLCHRGPLVSYWMCLLLPITGNDRP